LGCSYQIDFTSGRGFEYYTGVIFGFYSSARRLGGGGRYDELIPLVGGKDVRASGFALYIDELMGLVKEVARRERILVRAREGEELKASLETARVLRDAGYIAEFDLGYEETTEFRWIVNMRSGEGIELIDQVSGKKQRTLSSADLPGLLEEAGCR
jgi:histidyl-tRNA synthetase